MSETMRATRMSFHLPSPSPSVPAPSTMRRTMSPGSMSEVNFALRFPSAGSCAAVSLNVETSYCTRPGAFICGRLSAAAGVVASVVIGRHLP